MRNPVKGRTPAGRAREARAWRTRRRIAETALRLFLDAGYIRTTIDAIAGAAGVSSATIYQTFGTKQAILGAALDISIAGDAEPKALLEREWVQHARTLRDAEQRLRLIVARTSEVAARTAPIKEVMRDAAAVDPAIRELIAQDHRRRRRTQETLVRIILDVPQGQQARVRAATDTYFALCSSDSHQLMVVQLGWTYERWQEWLLRQLGRELLGRDIS